jgi:hypothetical protein
MVAGARPGVNERRCGACERGRRAWVSGGRYIAGESRASFGLRTHVLDLREKWRAAIADRVTV